MKTLGIITTTYNRAYCIHQVYESLKRQDCKDFMWLVVDDGSTDNTKEIIEGFIAENIIDIEYIYQENIGMTGARNTAYDNIKTEINTIIDSDDWLADGAVGKIIEFWNKNKKEGIAGIIALNASPDGKIVGTSLPEEIRITTFSKLFDKYKAKGDKKLIYRSELSKKYPYPVFEGEKFFPASYKFYLLDIDYEMLLMNEPVCIVDYTENSMSFNKLEQYKSCNQGFIFYRNEMMRISKSPKFIIKQAVHYIAECKLSRKKNYIKSCSRKGYAVLCWPIGVMLYFYLCKTKKKMIKL